VSAALYARVSTQRQAQDGDSLEAQEDRVREFCRSNDYGEPVLYVERGRSGRKAQRPELNRLLTDARAGDINLVVVYKIDRIARNIRDFWRIVGELEDAGCRVVSLREQIDTKTPQGRMMLGLIAGIAEMEAESIRTRSKDAAARKRERGSRNGGPAPYGYQRDGKTPDPTTAMFVQRIFAGYAAGLTQFRLMREFNEERVPTKNGGAWQQSTIRNILRNPIYGGYLRVWNQDRSDFTLAPVNDPALVPLVDEDTFLRVQAIFAATKGKPYRGRRGQGVLFTPQFPLVCGECGRRLTVRTRRNNYSCVSRRTHGPAGCGMPNVNRQAVEQAIIGLLASTAVDWDRSEAEFVAAAEATTAEVDAHLLAAEGAQARAEDRLARVRRGWQDGVLSDGDYREQYDELTGDRDAAVDTVGRLRQRRAQVEQAGASAAVFEQARRWVDGLIEEIRAGKVEDVDQFRSIACRVIDRVVVHRGDRPPVEVNGIRFEDGSLNLGEVSLEPVWRASAVLAPADLTVQGDDVAGSPYPAVSRTPLAGRPIKRDGTAAG
jgi:site-specific DNA recombinase